MPSIMNAGGPAPVSISFANNFWGKEDAGVGPLLERMHNAKTSCEELKAFYTARASIEDEYARKLLVLSKKSLGSAETGSLKQSLDTMKGEVDAMAKAHQNIAAQMKNELDEPLGAFAGAMRERRKIVQGGIEKLHKTKMQQTGLVNKTRDRYEKDCLLIKNYLAQGHMVMGQEERKNKAKLEKTQLQLTTSNADYESAIKALEETTGRWNRDWKAACDKFQDLEEERIDFMKSSLWTFANISSTVCVSDDASCEKIRVALEDCEVEKDIVIFISERGTGQEIPDPPKYINFRRGDLSDDGQSDEDGYTVAQFHRDGNPSFRSSSPNPSAFAQSAAAEPEPEEPETVMTKSREATPKKSKNAGSSSRRKSRTPRSEGAEREKERERERRQGSEPVEDRKSNRRRSKSTPDPRDRDDDMTPKPSREIKQDGPASMSTRSRHARQGKTADHDRPQSYYGEPNPAQYAKGSPYGAGRNVPHNDYPLDGITAYCRQPPSDISSASSPGRPGSSYGSEYSNPTSVSSGDAYNNGQVVLGRGSPTKEVSKKKSGFLSSHSPFRRKSKSEKDRPRREADFAQQPVYPQALPQALVPVSNRNTWSPAAAAAATAQGYHHDQVVHVSPAHSAMASAAQGYHHDEVAHVSPARGAAAAAAYAYNHNAAPQVSPTRGHRHHAQGVHYYDQQHRRDEPEPIDPRANVQLNIGGNIFDVDTPRGLAQQGRNHTQPVPSQSVQDDAFDLDPIAQALAELKGVHKKASVRTGADRFYGIQTPAPPATPGIGLRDARQALVPANTPPQPLPRGITPLPGYGTPTKASHSTTQPAFPAALQSAPMQNSPQRLANQQQNQQQNVQQNQQQTPQQTLQQNQQQGIESPAQQRSILMEEARPRTSLLEDVSPGALVIKSASPAPPPRARSPMPPPAQLQQLQLQQQAREQQAMEQQARELELREEQLKKQLKEQQAKEQKEKEERERLAREQQQKEQRLREQKEKEQQQHEQQQKLEQQQREQQLREQQLMEQQLMEQQQLREQQQREQQQKEQQLREQQLREQQQREQQLKEQQLKEQQLREQQQQQQRKLELQKRELQQREQAQRLEQQKREQQLREQQQQQQQQVREQQLREQQQREQQRREQQQREQQQRELQQREQQQREQQQREMQLQQQLQQQQQQQQQMQAGMMPRGQSPMPLQPRQPQSYAGVTPAANNYARSASPNPYSRSPSASPVKQQNGPDYFQRPQMPAAQGQMSRSSSPMQRAASPMMMQQRSASPMVSNDYRAPSPMANSYRAPSPMMMNNNRAVSPGPQRSRSPAPSINGDRPASQQSNAYSNISSGNESYHSHQQQQRPRSRTAGADARPRSSYGESLSAQSGALVVPGGEQETGIELRDPTRQYSRDGRPVLQYARARYGYVAAIPEELTFNKLDILAILRTQSDGWWEAEIVGDLGKPGLVPSNYLSPV